MTGFNMPDGCDPSDYEATIGEGPKARCPDCGLRRRECECGADAAMERQREREER